MDYKRVFILRAGASISHSQDTFPSINGFFDIGEQLGEEDASLKADIEILKGYARDSMGLKKEIDIEALFTHIEIELERAHSAPILDRRERILRIIRTVLVKLGQMKQRRGEYHDLVRRISGIENNKIVWRKDTILTFNWDILLDNAFEREHILREGIDKSHLELKSHYGNFLLTFTPFGEVTIDYMRAEPPYKEWSPQTGFYLKLHGSVDWFCCTNQNCRWAHKIFPILHPLDGHYCTQCHEPVDALLVPPVLNKQYRQYPIIRRIWHLAAKEMSIASELVIWGYSLPPTDFYSYWLLRQTRQDVLKKLIITNPRIMKKYKSARKGKILRTTFVRHIYDIFRNKLPKESVELFDNFTDYQEGVTCISKYNLGDIKKVYKPI